jgi:hypothetical protein
MNKVEVGFFSFTEVTDPKEHHAYNEWHQLDHMPEQYPMPGLAFGQRWVSTPACRQARAVDEDPLSPVHYMTLYLMTAPVSETLTRFMDLGQRLRSLGRFHKHRRSHLSGPFQLLEAHVAGRVLVSAEAIPYRPNLGVYVVVEDTSATHPSDADLRFLHEVHLPCLVEHPGVAGAWSFATGPRYGELPWTPGDHRITVVYLDRPPVDVAAELGSLLDERWSQTTLRPVLAGPFETITPFEWGWFDEVGATGGGRP